MLLLSCTHVTTSWCLSCLIVVEDVQSDPIVEVTPQHQRSIPTIQPSPPHHQQQFPQHLHQHQDNHHLQSQHRKTEMKMATTRTGPPNFDSSQNLRSTSSTMVYCSQPNVLGTRFFLICTCVLVYSRFLALVFVSNHVSNRVC